ncbi:MAG: DegV family EDD domain-containing protein, partial [Clostridia bacterium]|nr:DegV family EDD domain-containing protein [Clostridia bacterium]
MPFTIEDKSYEFEEECPSMLEYYDILKSGKLVNTAQVNQETARVMLKKVLEENPDKDMLFLSFSSGMSGSFNSVSAVGEELKKEFPDRRIVVIDTLSGAGSEGLLVYYAKKLQDEGASMDQVIEWVEQNKKNSHNIFIVDDLKNLRHSGRISSIAALFGIVFQIKPVLELSNEGKIALLGKAMGRKKAIDEIVRYFNEYYVKDANDFILVGHTGNEVDA